MDKEIWKPIEGYDGIYEISNLGRVKSMKRYANNTGMHNKILLKEKILNPCKSGSGRQYLSIVLSKQSIRKTYLVHILVGITFLGYTPNRNTVLDHIDNNQFNNRLDNLQIISQRKNASKDKTGYSSKYTGVFWNKSNNKWRSKIYYNGKHIHLGYFKSEKEAAKAYCNKLKELTKLS